MPGVLMSKTNPLSLVYSFFVFVLLTGKGTQEENDI